MITYTRWKNLRNVLRNYSTKVKPKVTPDETVFRKIDQNVYKPRQNPGIFKPRTIELPECFINAVNAVIEDHPLKSLLDDGVVLVNHLRDKRSPVEPEDMRAIKQNVFERVSSRFQIPESPNEEEMIRFKQMVSNKVSAILKKEVYNWKPMNYDRYNSLVYLVSRAPAEYAVLGKIFLEISVRDPEFKPRSLFDFGSGVGTATWAANIYWKKYIYEYFNVDSSSDMNDLSLSLLEKSKGTNKIDLRTVSYRQFLPASNISYDIVVSAYSLLELPSRQSRLETVLNLWNKTQQYLVLVEQGSNAGFQVLTEIRDFILHIRSDNNNGAHIFSPCPHEYVCPRFTENDGTPCNFEVFYHSFPLGNVKFRRQERYSYIVFKKGERSASDLQWPRIVRETLVRSKHTICRMCTKNAKLEEVIFTSSKHGKNLYYCARASKWGDLIPVSIEDKPAEDLEGGNS